MFTGKQNLHKKYRPLSKLSAEKIAFLSKPDTLTYISDYRVALLLKISFYRH